MTTKRKIVRDAFVNFLKDKTPAGDRVFNARVRTIEESEMPCINVRDDNEKVDIFNGAPRIYNRSLDIVVEIYCKTKQNIHDDLALLMAGIESVIDHQDRFPPLDEHIDEIVFEGSSINPELGDKTQVAGVGALRYRVDYKSHAGAMATDAPEYEQIFASFNEGQIETELIIQQ